MEVQQLIVNVNSGAPDELRAFYRDVVGLEVDERVGGFKVGDGFFIIDAHSDVSGPAKEPARALFNFFVADIDAETERLKAGGVPCARDRGREPWGGIISTFSDPDGNLFQLIEFRPA